MEPPTKPTKTGPKRQSSALVKKPKKMNANFKADIYEVYVQWCAIPKVLRGASDGVIEGSGFDLAFAREMLNIRSKTEFAAHFKMDRTTLTLWDKKIDVERPLRMQMNQWMRRLTPNVMQAFYMKAVKYGDAERVKLWAKFVEEWKEDGEADPATFMFQPQIVVLAPDDRLARAIAKKNEAKALTGGKS